MRWSTDGQWTYGSGALIDRYTILTCAHNLVDQITDPPPRGYAAEIRFYRAYNQQRVGNPPAGGEVIEGSFYPTQFQQGEDAWDVGVCKLVNPIAPGGNFFYFVPVETGPEIIGQDVNLTGYPGPRNGEMWWERDQVAGIHVPTNTIIYTHDTWRGNSGSPTWTYDNENNVVKQHAIHVQRQAQELRRGVLVTRQILAWIQTARHFADSTSQVSAPQEVKVETERAESAGCLRVEALAGSLREPTELCAEHVRQLGGESPLLNLMEVKS